MKSYRGKHLFDLILAIVILLSFLPLFIIVTVAIIIDSGWPVFYVQRRNGCGGSTFKLYKFRSMIKNAHLQKEAVRRQFNLKDCCFRLAADPRVTRVGKLLRRWNIDELPQLFNVIKGDMSFVGPRPIDHYLSDDTEYRLFISELKPGLTGYYQLLSHAQGHLDFSVRLNCIRKYYNEISFLTDCHIMLRTVKMVICDQKF